MPQLSDLQADLRRALLTGDSTMCRSMLAGGRDAARRLAIHQRHYLASLVTTLLERFPATVWLAGSELVTGAARRFVRRHPPVRPCIAEYGGEFPAFLAEAGSDDIPYLGHFAELEWHLGRLSLCVDAPPLGLTELSRLDPGVLADVTLSLQAGVHYAHYPWALHDLMSLYLTDTAPDQFVLDAVDIWLQLRGTRGELTLNRLGHPDFVFRATIARGASLGAAMESALDLDPHFDAGPALTGLFRDGLVTAITRPEAGMS